MRDVVDSGVTACFSALRHWAFLLVLGAGVLTGGMTAQGHAESCADGKLQAQVLMIGGAEQPDLVIGSECRVIGPGPFYFRHVNIVKGGKLIFIEPPAEPSTVKGQDFWATSIIIENEGALLAGVDDQQPYGSADKTLTIHLYGADPRKGAPLASEGPGESCVRIDDKDKDAEDKDKGNDDSEKYADCGIPKLVWDTNGSKEMPLPGKVKDYFYQYGNFFGDSGKSDETGQAGHFGYKVLALSYGGTLRLRGLKGTTKTSAADIATMTKPASALTSADDPVITSSGTDWARLAGGDQTTLTLDRPVELDWKPGDEIVVTPTDYLPEHAEARVITAVKGATVTLAKPLDYQHSATAYNVGAKLGSDSTAFRTAVEAADGGKSPTLGTAETRAAVGLLTRSIRVVSEGDTPGQTLEEATKLNPRYMYGGHTAFRQGFERLQIQGVEFRQLGQGGLLGRYPVHFHMARRVPANTYVIDSSINESMTRWVTIHSTLGVTLARNVGWKSIGHGYFLEDGTETDNRLYANLGVFARASVIGAANPRNIPGLLDARNDQFALPLKFHSDSHYPSVFWLTNGWNAVAGNMAAGAGACGACFWYVPAGNHDMIDVPSGTMKPMQWSGYSAIQADPNGPGYSGRAGYSPIELFYKNACSTAMHSLSVTDETPCTQIETGMVQPVPNPNPWVPDATRDPDNEPDASRMFYPRYSGLRRPAVCDPTAPADAANSCAKAECKNDDPKYCEPSVFSHYTSSFNWAGTNFAAVWLRSGYLLLDHLFLSDVQGPGVTIVTGGDYSRSNLPVGYWGLTTNSVFVGATDPTNPFAQAKGPKPTNPPFNAADPKSTCVYMGNVCLDPKSGIGYPLANWAAGQRLYNVYDGPAYEDANAFLDVTPSPCNSLIGDCMYYNILGVRKAGTGVPGVPAGHGYLANAAIAWKQSNGFYYPPAFHSRNLFFGNTDIRHYVIEPITYPGTYRTDPKSVQTEYVNTAGNKTVFDNYCDVDRQTELSDDDGSLTGFNDAVSVNEDPFFAAPVQTAECRSAVGIDATNACAGATLPNTPTARTSPYDHMSTALYPDPANLGQWARECSNENCTGVPIYREYLTGVKGKDAAASTREWATWMNNDCDKRMADLQGKTRPIPTAWGQPEKLGELTTFQKFARECPSPFVRMAGMNLYQRSVLTVNNGRYFIDTTVSKPYQDGTPELPPLPPDPDPRPPPPYESAKRGISVFQANNSYYLYFLFAKWGMKQTYQIYGGTGFTDGSISGVQVDVSKMPLPAGAIKPWTGAKFWTVTPDAQPGVLDIEVDFSKVPADLLNPRHLSSSPDTMDETCQPHTYCTNTAGTCGCDKSKLGVLGLLNPNYVNVCNNVCEHWAVKDLDCPKGGCLGFKFTMPGGFEAKDQFERPAPAQYPAADWTKAFTPTATAPDKATNAGGCYYSAKQIPADSNPDCKVAN